MSNGDPQAILQHPLAWDVLTPAERDLILARFPDETHVLGAGTADARPDLVSLLNDNNFRHDCARYAEGISNGWHDELWLWEAYEARDRRRDGEFDGVLEREVEVEWGVRVGGESVGKESVGETDGGGGKSVGEEGGEGRKSVDDVDDGREKSVGEESGGGGSIECV